MSDIPTRPSLIVRVRNRADAVSWREFYQYYRPLLMRYLRRLEVEEHTANDLVQEIFIRLFKTGISTNAVYVYASRVLQGVGKRCAALAEELGDEPFEWVPRGA